MIKEIKTPTLTAKLDELNNRWYIFRGVTRLGYVNAEMDGIHFTNPYTPLCARELNAAVYILDEIFLKVTNNLPVS